MWTLEEFTADGEIYRWDSGKMKRKLQSLDERQSPGARAFLQSVNRFACTCKEFSEVADDVILEISNTVQLLEATAHELGTAAVLRFGVVMAIEDFLKKLMVAQHTAQESSSPDELAESCEHVANAAIAVLLASEAAWNGSQLAVRWDPPELDLPEE